MPRRRRPQAHLRGRARAERLSERRSPLPKQTWLDRMIYAPCQLRLVLALGRSDHRMQAPFENDRQVVVVEPAPCEAEQTLAVIGAGELLAQYPHDCATVMVGEPLKSRRVVRNLPVLY
jgi:hypothetical protein